MSFHNSLTGSDIHVAVAFTYANAAARTGATVASTDIGKIAVESDTNRYYVLLNNSPVTWSQISGLDQVTSDSTTTGSAATLQSADLNYGVVRLTNGSLLSVGNIPAGSAGQSLVVENQTGNGINILDNNGATTTSIRTGTGATVEVLPNATVTFLYDSTASRWMMVGGSGSGGLSAWQASTNYNAGAVVTNGKLAYTALGTFTSSTSFATDLFDGYWQQLNLPSLGRNYAQTGNNFEDDTVGGWQLFTLQNQYTFTTSALSNSVPAGVPFVNNSQIFTVTQAAATGATTLVTSGTGSPTGGATTLTNTSVSLTVSALSNAVPVGAVYSNNGTNYTVIRAAAAGVTTLDLASNGLTANLTGSTLVWVSGAIPGALSAPSNVTFSAVSTLGPSSVSVSSNASAAYSAGAMPTTFPTLGTAASMSLAASNPGISGQYSLLVGNTLGNNLTAGQGVISPIFSVDQVDQARMLQNVLSYMATGGDASYLSFTGTSAGTWALYIQDITNGAWIQPAGVYNFVQGTTTLAGKSTSTWQTPSNLVFFRVALLCLNTTTATIPGAAAIATYFDDLHVGPQITPTGPAMTDWQSYTPSTVATNTTYTALWRRVGDSLQGVVGFAWSGAPSAWSTIALPTGLTIDTTKLGTTTTFSSDLGSGMIFHSSAAQPLHISYTNTTSVQIDYEASTTNQISPVSPTAPYTIANADTAQVWFQVPIVGWSSNTSMSSDTDTRVVAARYKLSPSTANGTYTANSATVVDFDTQDYDTHGVTTTGATWKYTVPVSGKYKVNTKVFLNTASWTAGDNILVALYKNGSAAQNIIHSYAQATVSTFMSNSGSTEVNCNAGDTLQLQITPTTTGNKVPYTSAGATNDTYIEIERLSGPAVVAATESIAASYSGTSSVIAAANTWNAVACTTRNYDTHSEYNTSTGAYTVPVSGKYRVTVSSGFTSTSGALTEGFFVGIGHNSSTSPSAQNGVLATTTSSNTYYCQCSQTIACVTGDTLYGLVQQSMNGGTNLVLQTAAAISYICIERVGN